MASSEAEARAWNIWADHLHGVCKGVDALLDVATEGRSAGFRGALRAALIEHLAELLRYVSAYNPATNTTTGGPMHVADVTDDDRHPATRHLARFFDSRHLRPELRRVAADCEQLAAAMILALPDGPELTAGLRKLLEAKDCFVRAALPPEGG